MLQTDRGDNLEFKNDTLRKHNAKNPSFSPEEVVKIQVIL